MAGESIVLEGVVLEQRRGGFFVVEGKLGALRRTVLAKLCGRMVKHRVRVTPGDVVQVECSPYDLRRGRIVFRVDGSRVQSASEGKQSCR